MSSYLVRYVLNSPGQEYQTIIKGIQDNYPVNLHVTGGTWIVKTNSSTSDVRDTLRRYCDNNDKLIVVGLTGKWATYNFEKTTTDWLDRNL